MHDLPEFREPLTYRAAIASRLGELGVAPLATTQPRVVYRFLRALYTFEIRERKARRRELERFFGPQPLSDYERQIEALREKYSLLRLPLGKWVEEPPA